MKRRDFLKLAGAVSLAGCATSAPSKARVVVIGGGFGGATAAKYIRLWAPSIDVVLVEREASFISCPISNLVSAGIGMERRLSRHWAFHVELSTERAEPAEGPSNGYYGSGRSYALGLGLSFNFGGRGAPKEQR